MERGETIRPEPGLFEQLALSGLAKVSKAKVHSYMVPVVREVTTPHLCGGPFELDPIVDDLRFIKETDNKNES
jgi:hypothetical protein